MTQAPLQNRLAGSTSPYLLQHAHNPVAWQPWDDAALDAARHRERPIFLSIGYAACHWCHVMERESFENAEVAAALNDLFVCIKVDREQRPDLDAIYMAATTALCEGRGGWPMSVFLTPAQQPFFAGTYFPPDDRPPMPSFLRVVRHLGALWAERRAHLLHNAAALTEALRKAQAPPAKARQEAPATMQQAHAQATAELQTRFDPQHGGFGPPPKFPHAQSLSYLLQISDDAPGPQREAVHNVVRHSLHKMGRGGIFDQLGGGFARYSTDAQWLVPHFEKMLYDNAELARLYAQAAARLSDPFCADIAQRTCDFVLGQWRHPQGGFYASLDADSGGVEGAYYVWTPAQIDAVLPAGPSRYVQAALDITEAGNWEGASIPNQPRPLSAVAAALGIEETALRQHLQAASPKLLAARAQRVAPALDDKIICGHNGLMISALAQAARLLNKPAYRSAAAACADFLASAMQRADGSLWRTYRAGQAQAMATLEDYAYLCEGLIDLYEAGAPALYLRRAKDLAHTILNDFFEPESGILYTTSRQHERLLWRLHEGHDGATASPQATAILCWARLHRHFHEAPLAQAAAHAACFYDAELARAPWAFAKLLSARAFIDGPQRSVVVCGDPDSPDMAALWQAASHAYHPATTLAHGLPGDAALPLLREKPAAGGAAVYLCEAQSCQPPLTHPGAVAEALAQLTH